VNPRHPTTDRYRRQWLRVGLGLGLAAIAGGAVDARPSASLRWRERLLVGFGTTLWLRAAHTDMDRVERALDGAVAILRQIERQMSLFDPESAVSRLNRAGRLAEPDPDLVRVLSIAHDVAAQSDGAFDASMQPLWRVWSAAHVEGRLPTRREIDAARARVGWRDVMVGPREIRFARPGMAVSLNGIAQGYAADRVREHLVAHGIAHALLDTGEWMPLGSAPDGGPWTLGIADPTVRDRVLGRLAADGRAVATSSDAHTTFSADRRHHHIVDPRTGWSPADIAGVTVVAGSCALADALTKVMFMAGWEGAPVVAARWGVDVLLVAKDGRWRASPGLRLA